MENRASLPHSAHYEHIRGVFKIHLVVKLTVCGEAIQPDRLAPLGLAGGFSPAL
jgi:hypothetical protein